MSFCLNIHQCERAGSSFCDPYHKPLITGDLRIIKNKKIRKLLTKCSNYRKPETKNVSKALIKITTALDTCIENKILKFSVPSQTLNHEKRKY